MFEDLTAAIEAIDVGADGSAIVSLIALADRLRATIAAAAGEFDAVAMWELDGATSLTAWLRNHTRMTSREAHRLSALSKALHRLPILRAAVAAGRVSWGQVEVLVSTLGQRLLEAFAPLEAEVVEVLEPLDIEATAVLAARIKAALDDGPEPDPEADRLHMSTTFGGRSVGDFEFGPESGAVLRAALAVAQSDDAPGEPARSPSQRRADALVDIARFFLDHQDVAPERRNRAHVSLVIEAEDLTDNGRGTGRILEGGDVLPRSSVEAFLCDCSLSRVLRSGSTVIDYGTSVRTISKALWGAVVVRDAHCRFPGCDRPASWCDAHHVVWYSKGGSTSLENLVLLCRRHHTLLHRPGWSASVEPDGTLEVTDPHDVLRTSHPPWWQPVLVPA